MKKSKIFYCGVFIALFFVFALSIKAMIAEELQKQIADLQSQIEELNFTQAINSQTNSQYQVGAQNQSQVQKEWCYDFKTGLILNYDKGPVVEALQTALKKEGLFLGTIKYPWLFDYTTQTALKKFQEKYAREILTPYNLTKGTGTLGPTSRAKLNQLYGCEKEASVSSQTVQEGTISTQSGTSSNQGNVQQYIRLQSTMINGNNLEIVYSKNFDTCVYLYTDPYYSEQISKTHTQSYFCQKGDNIKVVQLFSNFTLSQLVSGQKVRLCYQLGANAKQCSDLVEVTGSSAAASASVLGACSSCKDVDGDGNISARDSLLIINLYNSTANSAERCVGGSKYNFKYDINKDNCISEPDATCIIDDINKNGSTKTACGTATCSPNWQCVAWNTCVNNQQARTCADSNNCGTVANKPALTQTCIVQPITPTASSTCTETDGGKNYNVKGTAVLRSSSGAQTIGNDLCYDFNYLLEKYCEAGELKTEKYYCSNGCLDGACKQTVVSAATHSTCSNSKCVVISGAGSNQCAVNSDCAIVNTPPVADAGYDITTTEGEQIVLSGTRSYDKEAVIVKYYWSCTGGSLSTSIGAKPVYTAPQVSQDTTIVCTLTVSDSGGLTASDTMNIIVKNAISPIAICDETDGGKNYYTRGTAVSKNSSGNQTIGNDVCYNSYLLEKYCEGGEIKTEMYYCSVGCQDGACQLTTAQQSLYQTSTNTTTENTLPVGPADAISGTTEPAPVDTFNGPADAISGTTEPAPVDTFNGPADTWMPGDSSYKRKLDSGLASIAEALAKIKAEIEKMLQK